jgi:hypothetical protein
VILEDVTRAYLECGLWSTHVCDEQGEDLGPMDDHYDVDDCLNEHDVRDEIARFIIDNFDDCIAYVNAYSWASLGHDFCLTRDRHGAGFWDRGLGDLGRRLTDAAHPYGDSGFMPHDDDYFSCEGSTP